MCKKTNYQGTSNTRIDKCIKPIVNFLQDSSYETVASCCGYSKYPITVVVRDYENGQPIFFELFTGVDIPRKRRFYRKDKQGYYYIPEVKQYYKEVKSRDSSHS